MHNEISLRLASGDWLMIPRFIGNQEIMLDGLS